jgi:hypothetical protein
MDRQCKHKRTAEPTRPAAHSGTFTAKANEAFFIEAVKRAEDEKTKEIQTAIDPIENELIEFQLHDL